MALVQDIVAVRNVVGTGVPIIPNVAGQAQVQAQPPRFGNVTSITGVVTTDVVWADTGDVVTISHASLAASGLDIISEADAAEQTRLLGSWVRRTFGVGAPPLSAEFQGIVLAVYKRSPNASPLVLGPNFALVQDTNGGWLEDLATNFEVVEGR